MTDLTTARQRAQLPSGVDGIVNARSLAQDFPVLHDLLTPGMTVLDVGCAGGALTRGMAGRVGTRGRVVGVDADPRLVQQASAAHAEMPQLSFQVADAYALPFHGEFEVVCAARILQWLACPADALAQLVQAARPGGTVVGLDYNHLKYHASPVLPASFQSFQTAYLAWRSQAGLDNEIADHLPALFARAGLRDVTVTPQHETTRRGEPGFERRIAIKAQVIASRGHQLVQDGWITERERREAERDMEGWMASAQEQTLYLLAVSGWRPQ